MSRSDAGRMPPMAGRRSVRGHEAVAAPERPRFLRFAARTRTGVQAPAVENWPAAGAATQTR